MPKSKYWTYPLPIGTHVVAKVLHPQKQVHVQVVGTVVRVVSRTAGRTGCTYAVKTTDSRVIQTLSSQTVPIDTSTEEGADMWMDAIEQALREGDARHDGLPQVPETTSAPFPGITGTTGHGYSITTNTANITLP